MASVLRPHSRPRPSPSPGPRPREYAVSRPSSKGWGGRYAQVVSVRSPRGYGGTTLHLAGQTAAPMPHSSEPPNDLSAMNCKEQTATILSRIDRLLGENGATRYDVVRAWVFLHDPADTDEMNDAWDDWIGNDVEGAEESDSKQQEHRLPARTCLVASPQGHTPHCRVEITVDAYLEDDDAEEADEDAEQGSNSFRCCCLRFRMAKKK